MGLLNHGMNLWLITWGEQWVSHGSTGEGKSPVLQEGVEPGCTSPRPIEELTASGEVFLWRSAPLESILWAQDRVSDFLPLLQYNNYVSQAPGYTIPSVYSLIVHSWSLKNRGYSWGFRRERESTSCGRRDRQLGKSTRMLPGHAGRKLGRQKPSETLIWPPLLEMIKKLFFRTY